MIHLTQKLLSSRVCIENIGNVEILKKIRREMLYA